MSGPPPPGGFNPGAYEFRPGQGAPFVPRGQQQPNGQAPQQPYDPYAMYGQQAGQQPYYPQQQYGGYPQYGAGGYGAGAQYGGGGYQPQYPSAPPPVPAPQPQVQAFVPGQRSTFVPSQARTASPAAGSSDGIAKAPVSLSLGGAKPAASLSIGGAKAAPSLSIGGDKPKAAISIGAPKAAPSLSIGGSKTPVTIGKKEEKKVEEKPKDEDSTPATKSTPTKATPAPSDTTHPSTATEPSEDTSAPDTDATVKVLKSTEPTQTPTTTTSSTNFSKVSAKNDADAVYKEQAAAGAEAMRDLYGDDAKDPNIKSHLNIIFTGHVDAGKSTMGGQLLFLTGAVDKRTMEKYEQEAKAAGRDTWYLSWALDSNKEERAKGKTVEVGRAYFESEKRRYTILDAPGHKTYVPSMITGAAQADVAMLVLSARKGEFETGFDREGQTREHAVLIKNNGINKLVVVVNKMDDITVEWDRARFDEIKTKITPFLKSVGFNPKTDLTFIPVSAQMGQNMKDPIGKKVAPWYEGPSLLGFLDDLQVMDRDINAPFMLPISEKYNEMGTMVMGKVESGRVKKGDSLLLMPNKTTIEVAGLFTEQGEEMDQAFCGDNIRMRIRGTTDEDVQPGYVLSSVQRPVKAVTAFKADLSFIETKNIICSGYTAVLHVHTLAEEITLTALLHYYDRKTKRKSKKPPQFAKAGMIISALIETTAPICIETFKDFKQLGRFTLRDEGRTVAIGKVTKLVERSEDMPDVAALNIAAGGA